MSINQSIRTRRETFGGKLRIKMHKRCGGKGEKRAIMTIDGASRPVAQSIIRRATSTLWPTLPHARTCTGISLEMAREGVDIRGGGERVRVDVGKHVPLPCHTQRCTPPLHALLSSYPLHPSISLSLPLKLYPPLPSLSSLTILFHLSFLFLLLQSFFQPSQVTA